MDSQDRIQHEPGSVARVKGKRDPDVTMGAPLRDDHPAPMGTLTPAALLHLQRTAGNAAVVQLIAEERTETARPIRGGGEPLEPTTRADIERSFGTDFGSVRVHQGPEAARSAAAFRARDYTVGEYIVLGGAAPEPRTIAHELTHVVQQRAGPVDGTPIGRGVRVSDPADRFERAAESTADRVMGGGTAVALVAGGGEGLQRQAEAPEEEVQTLHRQPAQLATVSAGAAASLNSLVAPARVLQREPAKPATKAPAPPVKVHTESELETITKEILEGTHYLGSLAEIGEILLECAPFAHLVGRFAAFASPIGHVAMIVLMAWELVKAFQTHERISQAMGTCYGIMWQAMDLPDRPPPRIEWYLPKSTLEAGRAAFVRGVAEGRKLAQKPVTRNRILVAVAREGSEGDWLVLNSLWTQAIAKESVALNGTYIPWPTPGYASRIP